MGLRTRTGPRLSRVDACRAIPYDPAVRSPVRVHMRNPWLPLLALVACSDYDLAGDEKDPPAGRRDDTGEPAVDTADTTGTDDSADGGDTVGDSAEPDPDVPSGKIDVVLLVDVAYFYDCYHADLALRTSELLTALFSSGADVAVAIATYDDYQVENEWFAAWDGVPYALEQQLTTDTSRLQSVASGLELAWGGDGPGSGYEAVVQATAGLGYDQDCDRAYDASTDVKPFEKDRGDAFSGNVNGTADGTVPGTGTTPGVGFRTGSSRVVILLAENTLRDRGENHEVPSGACPGVAGRSDAVSALRGAGAKFLGVNAYEFQDMDTALQEQLEDLASSTGSQIDADQDGARDDVAVLSGSWDWPATSMLVDAIWDLTGP